MPSTHQIFSLAQTKFRRLRDTPWRQFPSELLCFRSFIEATPAFKAILDSAMTDRSFEPERWLEEALPEDKGGDFDWPQNENNRLRVKWYLIERWTTEYSQQVLQEVVRSRPQLYPLYDLFDFADRISFESGYTDNVQWICDNVVEWILEYIQARLATSSEVLYLLERYRMRTEWFEQDRLYVAYQGDTARGEDIYDRDLRRYLMDQGIDYPFSQPKSGAGRADVVGLLDTNDPLICEIKLFDGGKSKNISYLATGFHQAVSYAQTYNKPHAYLVAFNLTNRPLSFPNDDPKDFPPRLHVANVTVFLITVQALPLPSASERGRITPIAITREHLVFPTEAHGSVLAGETLSVS